MRCFTTSFLCSALCLAWTLPTVAHEPLDAQVADLTRRIEADPDDAALWLRRAELQRLRQEWPRALSDYRRARSLDPGLDTVDLCAGLLWLDRTRPRRAVRALDRFVARHPDHDGALAARARARVALGRHLAAAEDFSRAIRAPGRHSPALPDYYLERARALVAAGPHHVDAAIRGLEEGVLRLGRPASLLRQLVDLELLAGRPERALAHLEQIAPQAGHDGPGGRR
jgi:tetratricopeptide (TPR) repeat protein